MGNPTLAGARTALAALAVVFLAAAVCGGAPAPAAAQGPEAVDKLGRGPKIGERIPHMLGAPDQTGARRDFNAVKSGRGLVLLFNRSVDW